MINTLKSIFSRQGIPKMIISDNGGQFISAEFQQFSKDWNFKSIRVSPHHQQANGLAERTIQSIKKLMKKCQEANEDTYLALLSFRNTPVYNNYKYSPSQILMSRHLRDNLPVDNKKLRPKTINKNQLNKTINQSQDTAKKQYDKKGVKIRDEFKNDTLIWY